MAARIEQDNRASDKNSPGDCFGVRVRAVERGSETGDPPPPPIINDNHQERIVVLTELSIFWTESDNF